MRPKMPRDFSLLLLTRSPSNAPPPPPAAALPPVWISLLDDSMAEDANKHTNLKIDVPKWVGTYAVGMDAFKVR